MMVPVLNDAAILKMKAAGKLLSDVFDCLEPMVRDGISTLDLDSLIERELRKRDLVSGSKGYMGFKHVSCISLNDEVVHGIPSAARVVCAGDLVKVDVCASFQGYFADMARMFLVSSVPDKVVQFASAAVRALESGISCALVGARLSDISSAVQRAVESAGYGVVRDFAGHGIGKAMHEEPEILNYGLPGKGPVLRPGMAFAIEPMVTMRHYSVYVESDGWTVKTVDGSLAAHVEDTVIITDNGPVIVTRPDEG